MSADPVPPAPRTGRGLLAVLLAVGVVALVRFLFGFEFDRDTHLIRVLAAFGAALVCALVVVSRAGRAVRLLALLAALGTAAAAWWFVPGYNGAPSLAEASARRAELRAEFARPLLDDPEHNRALASKHFYLETHYPRLATDATAARAKWVRAAVRALGQQWEELPAHDFAGARALIARGERLPSDWTNAAGALSVPRQEWTERAEAARVLELRALAPGDWDGFARTTAGRTECASFVGSQLLAEAETDWVNKAARAELLKTPLAGSEHWAGIEHRVLELTALATGDDRFSAARRSLFDRAHEVAQRAAAKHIEAREYDAAFALARAHAVRWNATASLFGEEETKKLDALRDACAVLARFAEIAGPPGEVAPAPREKP